jgi:cytochrome c-type biogenesis protein CcsB
MGKSPLTSYRTAIVLLGVYALALAAATFIEKYWGTAVAKLAIYYSPIFFFLQLLLVVNFIAAATHRRLFQKKKWGFMAVHAALMVILAGALTTHIWGREGTVHLREGESATQMVVHTGDGASRHALPFRLELKKFTVHRYPGSSRPSGFESVVVVHDGNQSSEKTIAMNRVLDVKGYRFFQASYDDDEKGSVLSVNRDAPGRSISYAGYALLVAGFVLSLFGKNSRFRQLSRSLKAGMVVALCLLSFPLQAQHQLPLIDGCLEPVSIFAQAKKVYLIAGGLLLTLAFISLFRQAAPWLKRLIRLSVIIISANALYHLSGIILRWYAGGYAPFSNTYETMIYVSFITVAGGLFFIRRSLLAFALASLFGGIVLFAAGISGMDSQTAPLAPVLKSPWLLFHVAVIVAAYGFFGISFLLGVTNLLLLSRRDTRTRLAPRIRELSVVNEMSLWLGLALMTTGAFLGAVWANETWGRYWGWDPKETWALVTIVAYTLATHLHLVKKWDTPLLLNLMSVLAFACAMMTYFGVSYFLGGMHAYN